MTLSLSPLTALVQPEMSRADALNFPGLTLVPPPPPPSPPLFVRLTNSFVYLLICAKKSHKNVNFPVHTHLSGFRFLSTQESVLWNSFRTVTSLAILNLGRKGGNLLL